MSKSIITLNKDLTVNAFLDLTGGKLSVEYISLPHQKELSDFLERINNGQERVKAKREVVNENDDEHSLYLAEVSQNDPLFLQGIVDELNGRSILSHLVESELKEVLILLNGPQVSFEQRRKMMGDVLNTGGEKVSEIKNMIKEIKEAATQIEKNHQNWQSFLDQKREEILKRLDNSNENS